MSGRRSRFAVATLALAATLLASTPAAGADPDLEREAKPAGFDSFGLRGSNGYSIRVLAFYRPGYGESSEVVVIAGRKGRAVSYSAPAVVTDRKIEADLGALGEIDVTLRRSGKEGVTHPRCAPKREVRYEKGTYVGTIDFRGEEGYTQVSTDRARFSYGPLRNIGCSYSITAELFGRGLPGARLRARTGLESGDLTVQANQNRPGGRVRVEAAVTEDRGRISIFREITSVYPADSFHFAPDLSTAFLDPPAPFSGTGVFRRNAEPARRWTGSFRVDFPGRSNVALTGDRFRTSLRHARLIRETRSPSRPNLLQRLPAISR